MKVTAHKAAPKKGKVRRMTIEPAHGGFTSQVEHHHPDGDRSMMYHPQPPTPTTIHPSLAHLKKHVASTFAGDADGDEGQES